MYLSQMYLPPVCVVHRDVYKRFIHKLITTLGASSI